jgi:flagellar motor switch protein FliN/FliY
MPELEVRKIETTNPEATASTELQSYRHDLELDTSVFEPSRLEPLRQVPMTVQVEVGRTTMRLGEIVDELHVGSSIRLDRHAGDPDEVYVNGALFARAEVVVMQDQIGAKIIELVEAPERPSGLR